jgi:hypothetical protein
VSAPQAHPEAVLLERAIGGWRGMIDSGLPSVVFVAVYLLNGRVLQPALIAAIATGVVILVWRLFRRQPLTQVLAGFAGVAISAYVSSRTGEARDFFLWGLIVNVVYGSAFLISLALRWPLMGVVVGAITGDPSGWRQDPDLRRVFAAATWVWVFVFGGRILVQVPLYLAAVPVRCLRHLSTPAPGLRPTAVNRDGGRWSYRCTTRGNRLGPARSPGPTAGTPTAVRRSR